MSEVNIEALDTLFAPPAPTKGLPTTQQMQQTAMLARVKAKLGLDYAAIHLKDVEAEQKVVDAEIDSNPTTASPQLRKQQEQLQAKAQSFSDVLNTEYPNYTNGVQAWFQNMTSGAPYVALDKWTLTLPASYPHLFACESVVTF
jgi:hypothetical protein